MKNLMSILIFILLLASCSNKADEKIMYDKIGEKEMLPVTARSTDAPPPPPVPGDKMKKQEVTKKKIIKDGFIRIRVSDLEKAKKHVDTLLEKHEGYYAKEDYNNTERQISYTLKIRVPSANFESFITAVEAGEGEIQHKQIDARDVTAEFIDLETRLENKRKYLKRYNELLVQARTVEDILEIQEKIRRLEEEIESTTGRLNYLSDLVDYSTLELALSKKKQFRYNPADRDNFSERVKQSLSRGWYGFIDFLLFVIKIWPFWIILGVIIYFWKKYKKRKKAR